MSSILVIDDEKEICESIRMILEYEDYHVETTTDGIEGIEKIEAGNFDVVLLDIFPPY